MQIYDQLVAFIIVIKKKCYSFSKEKVHSDLDQRLSQKLLP